MAHGAWGLLDRRPDLPRRQLPAPAPAAGRPADRVLAGGQPGTLSGRPVLVLPDPAGNPLARRCGARAAADPPGLRVRERRLPLPGCRAMGRAPPRFPAAGRRSAGPGRRERRRQDHAGEAAGAAVRTG
uniref:Uncharacterized protein n=1 Tax=Panagrolaimus superbus TaxID=310955 RepID=A0A914Z1M0_9BILA